MPAFLSGVRGSAAGEGGHALLKRDLDNIGKPLQIADPHGNRRYWARVQGQVRRRTRRNTLDHLGRLALGLASDGVHRSENQCHGYAEA
jgi:hypothetical protein